jgi:hypothetical protein
VTVTGTPTLLTPERLHEVVHRPYPGFRPFRRSEWRIFFGRDGQVDALLDRLARQHFVCIHGPSGCGKSSLVEAGLIATLDREARRSGTVWNNAIFRPGNSPLWNMARGLARAMAGGTEPSSERVLELHAHLTRPGGSIAQTAKAAGLGDKDSLLLVADQFEELFRFSALGDPVEARRFVELLLGVFDQHPPGVHVAIAMRSDFLGDCASMIGLAEAVNAAPFLTPVLTEQELTDAIVGPAEMVGGSVDPEFVERILRDSAGEPDRLPIVQHALMRCWDMAAAKGTPKHLTVAIYEDKKVGGVQNALDRHANEIMETLAGLQPEVELMFRSLSDLDGASRAIRRAVPWGQLCGETGRESEPDKARMLKVLDAFRDESCGFIGRPQFGEAPKEDSIVDIAHEALIRRWHKMSDLAARDVNTTLPRLRSGWLWDQVRDAQIYRDLINRAHDEEGLPSALLAERYRWWQARPRTIAWARRVSGDRQATENDVGAQLRDIEALFERSRQAHDRELNRRRHGRQLKWLTIAAGVALVVLGIVTFFAVQKAKVTAEIAEQTAKANDEKAKAVLEQEKATQEAKAADAQETLRIAQQRDLRRLQDELDATNNKLTQATQALAVATAGGSGAGVPAIEQKTEVAKSDITNVAALAAPSGSEGDAGCVGAIWVGSQGGGFNLRSDGKPFDIATVKEGDTFVAAIDIRLRRTLPDAKTGQGEPIGVVPSGARVTALGIPQDYKGSNGSLQYWLKVRAASQVCSVVYLQYAGPANDATALSDALKALGYAVPGKAEQLRTAAGLAEIRYYYPEDEKRAQQLAEGTDGAIAKLRLGIPQNIKTVGYTNWDKTKKPPRGTLELWLDLSPTIAPKK